MRKLIYYSIISFFFIITATGQSGVHTQSFSGNHKGASISGTIKYKAECYLGNPYVSVVIGNVSITSYTYQGRRYSGNDIPEYQFPVRVNKGILKISASFKYGVNSRISAGTGFGVNINSSVSGGLSGKYMDDKFSWNNESSVKEIIKSHGVKNCSDNWGKHLGKILNLSINGAAGLDDGVDQKLEEAIKKLIKNNKAKELLNAANRQFSNSNYDAAEKLYRDVLKVDYSNQEAKDKLAKISLIKKNEKLEKAFNDLISSGDNYYRSEDYTNAIQEYKRALNNGFDNEKAQSKIQDAQDAKEKQLQDLKAKKDAEKNANEEKAEKNAKLKEAENKLDETRAFVQRGDAFLKSTHYNKAINEYKKALVLDPDNTTLKNHIKKIETSLKNKKEEKEFQEKLAEKKAKEDAEYYANRRERLAATEQSIDAQIKAAKKAGDYIQSSINQISQQNASYNAYKSKIEAATRMRKSDDPDEIIRQFNDKLVELERLSEQRYNQLVKEIKAYHAQQSSYNTTQLDQAATNLGVALGSMGLSKRIAKEKAASVEKLEGKKREMLTKIKDNLVKDFKKNRENFFRRAASEIAVDKEKYYLDMTKYYQCKIDRVQSQFSIDNTDWVNPYCNKVTENSSSNNSPSDKQLFDASLRKYKNPNKYYQQASKDFVGMAIKANPKKADYYFHRAKFEETGSKKHISLLMKTFDLNKDYPNVKKLLAESLAEKKRTDETTFFDKDWKITSKKEAFYYRPLVDMKSNPFRIKNYYSSNNQLQMEGFATGADDKNNIIFDGEVIFYFESGEVDSRAYYNKGVLKQVLKKNKNGYIKIGFFNGKNNPLFVSVNFGKIIDINNWNTGFVKNVKWNYTSAHKKKYNKYLGFNFDERGDLLFRDEYNAKGKLIDRKVEDRIDAMHAASENYIENKEYKQAIKFLENGIVLYPNDALLHYYLGYAKSRNENLFSSLNKTINKSVNVSLSNKISKNNEEAIEYFIKGLNLVTNNKELELKFYNELGNLYYKVEYFSKSAEIFNKALKIQPRNAPLLNSYSRSLALSTQQLDEAQKMIKLCNSIEPNNHNYQDTYAWVLYKKGNFKEANIWLDKAFENGGKVNPIIWEHKGDVSYKLGDKNTAIDCWEMAKSLNKENGGKVSDYLNQKIKKKMLLE
ncbi:tetratricopeptide repeat protein [Wocania ichthyoenteri]|uniref:tetratricopeptide repeat protein n=1 Tax=Wocania ichthyoenteri TaxID=1230531 RepID=UPI00053ECDBF|nr:hypothetical protein [Wocania ichthyoenteri]